MRLLDGRGRGHEAAVNSDLQVNVRSASISEESYISQTVERAFSISNEAVDTTLQLATTEVVNFMYVENTSATRALIIENVFVSSDTAGVYYRFNRNPVLGTASANTAITPQNLNFGSGVSFEGTVHVWDESGTTGIGGLTVTSANTLGTFITPAGLNVHPFDASLILKQNNSFLVIVENPTGGNVEVACAIRCYFVDNNKLGGT